MPIYKVVATSNDPDGGPVDVSYQFCKLGQVIYDAHNRQVYVSATNEKTAIKKGLKFIKAALAEDLKDDQKHNT